MGSCNFMHTLNSIHFPVNITPSTLPVGTFLFAQSTWILSKESTVMKYTEAITGKEAHINEFRQLRRTFGPLDHG